MALRPCESIFDSQPHYMQTCCGCSASSASSVLCVFRLPDLHCKAMHIPIIIYFPLIQRYLYQVLVIDCMTATNPYIMESEYNISPLPEPSSSESNTHDRQQAISHVFGGLFDSLFASHNSDDGDNSLNTIAPQKILRVLSALTEALGRRHKPPSPTAPYRKPLIC